MQWVIFVILLVGTLPSLSLEAPAIRSETDSPIQIISIRPAPASLANRAHRRMPGASKSAGSSGKNAHRVVNIDRLRADAMKPVANSGKPTANRTSAVRVNVPPLLPLQQLTTKRAARPMRGGGSAAKVATLPFQRGDWLRYDAGPSPIYYARARANGLFQVHTLKVAKLK